MKINFEDLIIFENDDFLIINKPPFLSTLADRNDPVDVQKFAKQYYEKLSACHRLDKGTSGALLLSKSPKAYRHAAIQFEKREVSKLYHAVVDGKHDLHQKKAEFPILPLSKGRVRVDFRKGKEATTFFETKEVFRSHSLIACKPITGRMHQIRIHLSKLGAPIVNDLPYGGQTLYLSQLKRNFHLKKDSEEMPLIKRFALHASQLSFRGFQEEEIIAEADYPKDFQVLLKQLRKYNFSA